MDMINEPRVNVLISTYNGANYIEQQLNSILLQEYQNYKIIVRDDGSSDNTVSIIEKIQKNNTNIILLKGKNLGFEASFFELLKYDSSAEYYVFSDQDDVWIENRIRYSIEKFQENDASIPGMIFCNYNVWTEKGIDKRFAKRPILSFANSLYEPTALGFAQTINSAAREIIVNALCRHGIYSHDWWSYMVCSAIGYVDFVEVPCVNYRRHINNVSIYNTGKIVNTVARFRKYFINGKLKLLMKQQKEIGEIFYDYFTPQSKRVYEMLFDERGNRRYTLKRVFYRERYRQNILDEILIRILQAFGII